VKPSIDELIARMQSGVPQVYSAAELQKIGGSLMAIGVDLDATTFSSRYGTRSLREILQAMAYYFMSQKRPWRTPKQRAVEETANLKKLEAAREVLDSFLHPYIDGSTFPSRNPMRSSPPRTLFVIPSQS
jgi:hypothetical protein